MPARTEAAGPPAHGWNEEWLLGRLETCLGGGVAVRRLRRVSNGFSWITCLFESRDETSGSCRELVLRIGPPNGLLAPYSAMREAAMLAPLRGRGIPVPEIFAASDDETAFEAPYLICEKMAGSPFVPWSVGREPAEAAAGRPIMLQFAQHLAAIHATDWAGSSAAPFAAGAIARGAALEQVAYWETRYRDCETECLPIVERAFDWLKARAPDPPRLALLHGDYRIGNFLTEGDRITAILDWELAHFGDPHQDLAWALYPPFGLSRLIDRSEFIQLYSAGCGVQVSEASLAYYAVFAILKMTIINLVGLGGFLRGSRDMRLVALALLTASQLAQLMKAVKAAA